MNLTTANACGFCRKSTGFTYYEHTPAGSSYKIFNLRCKQCGAIVGILDFTPTSQLLQEIQTMRQDIQAIKVAMGKP